jgi:hypothetical protein
LDPSTLITLQDMVTQGRSAEARKLLFALLESDPSDVQAWLWLSEVEPAVRDKRQALIHALLLDPTNRAAKRALSLLPDSSLASRSAHSRADTPK